jgi:lysophospholipase L1-like esterase
MATYAYRDTDLDAKGHHIGGGADQESFAESIANNVYCKPGAECNYTDWRSSTAIVYNRQCGATYDWIKTNIFGGDDFFAPTGTKSNYSFVALGDSLTAWPVPSGSIQTNGVTLTNGSPWPSQLETEEPSLHLTKNAGVPKNTTADMLNRFSTDVTANHPDVLIVLGGTNDAGRGIDTVGNIKQIITNANNAGISKIVVLTIPNQCPPSSGNYSAINTALENLKSATVSVVDITTPLTCGSNYQADGLHLTNEGAKKVADTIDLQLKNEGFFTAGGDTTPNKDTCGGAYDFSNSMYKDSRFLHQDAPNFGDPGCTMADPPGVAGASGLDHFYSELKRILNGATTTDGAGKVWDDWVLFNIIVKNESSYNPNDFYPEAHYGLFQMNPASAGRQSYYDVGDVNWPVQIYNAAMYNYRRDTSGGCKFTYWSTTHWWNEDPELKIPWTSTVTGCVTGNKAQPVQ